MSSDKDYKVLYDDQRVKYLYVIEQLAKARQEIAKLKEIIDKENIYIITKP